MKYEYRYSGIDWIGNIPKHWKVRKLKVVGEAVIGLTYTPNDVTDEQGGTLVLRSSNIQNGKYSSEDCVFVKPEIPEKLITKKGDILLCARNGSAELVGKNITIDEQTEGKTFGAFMTVFRSPYNEYLRFFFNSELFKSQSGSFSTSTINQLTQRILMNMQITFPPKSEQIAIANYLDKACADIDRVVEIKRKQIENLQQQLKSIIHHTVTKGLNPKAEMKDSGIDWIGEVPKHWKKEKIFRVAEFVTSGGTPKSGNEEYYLDGDIYWIQSGDLNDGVVSETEKKITKEGLENSSAKLFPKDTLLVAMYGATIGKLGIQAMEAATNQACCAIYPVKRISLRFLYYFFFAIRDKYISDAYGGGQPNISQSLIKQTYFYVPEKKEQIGICEFLDKELNKVKIAQSKIEKQIEVLLNYKKSLIHEVVTGKKQVV